MKSLKAIMFGLLMTSGCAHMLSGQDNLELGQYEAEQASCVERFPGDKAAIDACRNEVKNRWRKLWDERFDGGFSG